MYKRSDVTQSVASFRLLALSLGLFVLLSAAELEHAHADAQGSVRGALGLGKRDAAVGDEWIFAGSLVGDLMFGRAAPKQFRIGPTFELRGVDFQTLEAALGGGILIPLPGDFPIGLSGLVGVATRKQAPDGAVGIGTLTWGYRGYNFHSWYGWGINAFASARKHLGDEAFAEFTFGVEVDMVFTALIPILGIRNYVRAKDPDEPVKE